MIKVKATVVVVVIVAESIVRDNCDSKQCERVVMVVEGKVANSKILMVVVSEV